MPLPVFFLALAAALAADTAFATGYSGAHYRLNLPGSWSMSTGEQVTSYRSEAGLGVVTVAVYALKDRRMDRAQRGALLLRASELSLRAERKLGGDALELKALPQQRQGGVLRARYRGREPASGRRFASFMVLSPDALHSLYYEAQGLSASAFARLAGEIERGLEIGARSPELQSGRSPLAHPVRSPGLLPLRLSVPVNLLP